MSSEELSMWMAYEVIEPFGETRADIRAGIIASTIANVNRGKNQKAFSPEDFMVKFDRSYLEVSEEELQKASELQKTRIQRALRSSPGAAVKVYEGAAPAVRRIGKRGRSAKSGKRRF